VKPIYKIIHIASNFQRVTLCSRKHLPLFAGASNIEEAGTVAQMLI
jgi:hypothetical protein